MTARIRRFRPRMVLAAAALLLASGTGALVLAAEAGASGTLQVSPSTNLTNGQTVTVSGSGLTASSTGAVIQCNNDPAQPTITVLGNEVPVSCTNPLSHIKSTDASGNLASFSLTVVTGVVGPPGTGTDSGSGDATTDAANYPCPPTAAQITAGDSCVIAFGDQGGDKATQAISFSGGSGNTGTTGDTGNTGGTTTTTSASTTTTTTTSSTSSTTTTTTPCSAKSTTSNGSPSLTANPGTCLNGGTKVTVTGSGFDSKSAGAVLECNNDSAQPTVDLPAPISQTVPVSCSGISAAGLVTTGADGSLSAAFTIISPTTGPPCGGSNLVACPATDSGGKAPAADAANYPCPPTAAQLKAGDSCVLAFGDAGGKQAKVSVSFVPSPTPSSGSQATGTQTSASAPTNGSAAAVATSPSSLAFTGPGPGLWVLAIGGIVLIDLGFLVLTIYYRPRQLFAMAGRRVNRIFGGRT